ncbi:hypothetical protein GGR41_000529 [Paenalcaligenes hominis]|uniref:Transposase InsH N-terminal domain-containing protein n=1 Tax=Paenalcaligenes hominis TaxID=643674 RepID=A0ABX0WPL7_9BURK|nr:hypothetical protein [Paenalcaligenes hominis]GGE68650.1 hypothetical protein GCM10007278_15920 [Paenalcaligenes hominis]
MPPFQLGLFSPFWHTLFFADKLDAQDREQHLPFPRFISYGLTKKTAPHTTHSDFILLIHSAYNIHTAAELMGLLLRGNPFMF